jgi:hypothetical protein
MTLSASDATSKGLNRSICLRMKSTLTKRGCHFKSSGYRVRAGRLHEAMIVVRLTASSSYDQRLVTGLALRVAFMLVTVIRT